MYSNKQYHTIRFATLFVSFLLLLLTFQARCQISPAFYSALPDSLRPQNRLIVNNSETIKLMSRLYMLDAAYYPEVSVLAANLTKQAATEKDSSLKKEYYNALCTYYFNVQQYNTALRYCDIILDMLKNEKDDNKGKLKISTLKGSILATQNEYEKSIPILLGNLKIYQRLNDSMGITNVSMRLAAVYNKLEMYNEEIQTVGVAEKYLPRDNFRLEGEKYIALDRASTYILYYSKHKDRKYLDTAEKLTRKVIASPDAERWITLAYCNLAALKVADSQYKEALAYCDSGLKKKYLLKDPSPEMAALTIQLNKGLCLLKTDQKKEGYQQISDILSKNKWNKSGGIHLYMPIFNEMYEYAQANGLWKDALHYHKLYKELGDTLNLLQNRGIVFRINQKYNVAAKESRIQVLQYENTRQRNNMLYASLVALLAIVIIILIFRNRQRRLFHDKTLAEKTVEQERLIRQRELIQLESKMLHQQNDAVNAQRKQISEDMHDDLSSSLAGLKFYITDIMSTATLPETRLLLESVQMEVDTIYKNARQYIHHLNSNLEQRDYDLAGYLNELSNYTFDHHSFSLKLQYDPREIDDKLNTDQQYHLYHIIREAVTNIVKHSKSTAAVVALKFENAYCMLTIFDNGAGFDSKKSNDCYGLGLQSMANRTQDMGGTFNIRSGETGTTLTIRFMTDKQLIS